MPKVPTMTAADALKTAGIIDSGPANLAAAERIEPPLAVSIKEAARLSGLSRSFLYCELKASRLRAIRKGGRRLILVDDLRAYLASSD